MTRAILLLTAITITSASAGTIATFKGTQEPSDTNRNVSKREVLEFYPDWVPFKNKHGDELGEFVDVTKPKAKVKKRLALPMNFLMRAVSDDIDDLGQGEADNDDEYYKKDTVNTAGDAVIPLKTSDIDGLIQIITQDTPSLADDINKSISKSIDKKKDEAKDNAKILENLENITTLPERRLRGEDKTKLTDESTDNANVLGSLEDITTTPEPKVNVEEKLKWTEQSDEDYEDDTYSKTTTTTTTKKPELSEEEQKENERRKKIILDSVDQLKERHVEEQRAISRKATFEVDEDDDDDIPPKAKPTTADYDEYEDTGSGEEKYRIIVEKKTTTTTEQPTTESLPPQTSKTLGKNYKNVDVYRRNPSERKNREQYSVFKNPELYTVDDEGIYKGTLRTTPLPRRFSSRYASTPRFDSEENDIYPTQSSIREGSPAPILYFPKVKTKRKHQKSKFNTATTSGPDASVAETVEDKLINKQTTLPITYPTSADTTWSDIDEGKETKEDNTEVDAAQETTTNGYFTSPEEAIETEPSGEAASSNSETVTDAVPASSDHKKEEPKDYHVEKGGGHEHHSSFEEEHEEHGKKAYEGLHKDTKTKKGHHDKEDHLGKYEDHGGHDKKHHDESGHYGAHHHEEHGKKHAKYEESGKHSKGHSTKGSHDIHKKEEYEKKVEFFEEEGDSAEEEKHGGHHNEQEHKSVSDISMEGGQFKKGNLHNDHHEKKKGESGHFVKGGHHDVNKGHKSSAGHDSHGKHGGARHAAGGQQAGKKWVYHHGYPAKNANLIVIDRRADRYMHGPSYYG